MKNLTIYQIWWKSLGSYTKLIFARRHYPATHIDWLTPIMIENIYNKEKL